MHDWIISNWGRIIDLDQLDRLRESDHLLNLQVRSGVHTKSDERGGIASQIHKSDHTRSDGTRRS